jgi:hypothetical protein
MIFPLVDVRRCRMRGRSSACPPLKGLGPVNSGERFQ